MRLAAYAGVSTALAMGVMLRAFHERPNFYSASVYLAQSNACRLILLNVLLLFAGSFMFGLQRLLYGPLRPIEVEQLWDKAWYAITETALAMTIFREEVGGWFFLMFLCLLAGKVWGWIGEGRVEILEQQPPTNPRLFHTRLVASLLLSEAFDILMLRYCVNTLLVDPRPGMMVMFAFEFAVLAITSSSTAARYALSLRESLVIKEQTRVKLEERREEIRAARQEAERQAAADGTLESQAAHVPREDDIDENDIDVPGWSEKGRWVLFLDLATDFLKLVVYICFFIILLVFHGIPIHIFRDVLLTARSFLKRILDFLKYRNATRDMNERYPDATPEELDRDGTCIICREEMRPWQQPAPRPEPAQGRRTPPASVDERQRPKKLPCGHILHFGCLRSWLERQQVCPTCRSSVLAPPTNRNAQSEAPGGGPELRGHGQQAQDHHQRQAAHRAPGGVQAQDRRQNPVRARVWNLGPWRFTFAAGGQQQVRDALQRLRDPNDPRIANPTDGSLHTNNNDGSYSIQEQLNALEVQTTQEINNLALAQSQLGTVRALQAELARLRASQATPVSDQSGPLPTTPLVYPQYYVQTPNGPALAMNGAQYQQTNSVPQSQQYVFTGDTEQVSMDADSPNLPRGMVLPSGWTLLPLNRVGLGLDNPSTNQQDSDAIADVGSQGIEAQTAEITETSNHDRVDDEQQAQLAPTPILPNWSDPESSFGGSSREQQTQLHEEGSTVEGGDVSSANGHGARDAVEPSENGHADIAKMKGRAATVEEDDEDRD